MRIAQLLPSRGEGSRFTSIRAIPLAAVLLATGALVWISIDEYRQTIEQEYRFLDAHARIAQSEMEDLVHDVRKVMNRVAEEYAALPAARRSAYSAQLAKYGWDIPEVHTLAVLSPQGRVVAAVDPKLVGFDGSKREYFTAHLDGPRRFDFHLSRPYKTVYGDYSVGMSLPMTDDKRRLLGIVVAGVHYKQFDAVMKEIRPQQPNSSVSILNSDGDLLYRQPDPESYIGRNVAGNPSFKEFLQSGRQPAYTRAVAITDGVDRLYVYRPVQDTQLNISVARPIDDVLATWRRNLALRTVVLLVAATLILKLSSLAQRRQKEALASKEFTDRLIHTANAMMVGIDVDARILAVNEATERITGYRREELVGHSVFETIMPRDRFPLAWEAFRRYRSGGTVPRAFQASILTRAGEERIIAWQNSRCAGDEPLFMLAFGIDVTERTQLAEARNREEVSRRLVGIHEEERRRLAVELHDRTSPNLTVMDINLKLLASGLPPDAPLELVQLIDDTSATLKDTVASIRAISFNFRPPLLDYAGLWPALTSYAQQFARRTGIAVTLSPKEPTLRLPAEFETNLFRIAQEALANCARHSHAERIAVCFVASPSGDVVLSVSDDGVGFDDSGAKGHGLAMMCQRAEFIGGKIELDSHPGEGTRVAVRFRAPVAGAAAPRVIHLPFSQSSAPNAAARPPAMQAVSR